MIRNIFIGALALTILTSGALSFVEVKTAQPATTLLAQNVGDPFGPPPPFDPPEGDDNRGGSGGGNRGGSGEGNDGGSGGGNSGNILRNPLGFDTIEHFFAALLSFIVRLGFIVVTVALIWVGFLFVKAQGRPDDLKTAKEALMWTLVGAVILLGAEAISLLIQATISDIQDATR